MFGDLRRGVVDLHVRFHVQCELSENCHYFGNCRDCWREGRIEMEEEGRKGRELGVFAMLGVGRWDGLMFFMPSIQLKIHVLSITLKRQPLVFETFLALALAITCRDVSTATNLVFIDHEPFQADRTAGMNLVRADAHLGAKTEAHPVGHAR